MIWLFIAIITIATISIVRNIIAIIYGIAHIYDWTVLSIVDSNLLFSSTIIVYFQQDRAWISPTCD